MHRMCHPWMRRDPQGDDWTAAQKAAVAEAAEAAGLDPEILLSIGPPGRGKSMPTPSPNPPYDGDLSPMEVDCLTPFLVKEMRTRGKVSAVDCLNSLIWVKRHNCYWTRTPEDRYGNREHRRKLIERWAGEARFDTPGELGPGHFLVGQPEEGIPGNLQCTGQPGSTVAGATIHPSGIGSRQCETSFFERTPSVRPCHPTTH